MRHVLNAEQFEPQEMAEIFETATDFRTKDRFIAQRRENMQRHIGRIMLSMFYEPSTRTRFSFEIAAAKLGIKVVGTENAEEFSSAAKGETIEDTVRVFNEYGVDAIVLRTKEEGQAQRAASVKIEDKLEAAILNGGDGKGEHPTQALLDMYTIQDEIGRLDNLNVVIGGDLQRGRTARSLAQMLAKYPDNQITFVSTPELQISEDIKNKLQESGTKFSETNNMIEALKNADVAYWTRLQLERGDENANDKKLGQNHFALDEKALEALPDHAIILHPLPRQAEIPEATDNDSRAKYFRQSGNGLYVRMALLDKLMARRP